MSPDKINGIGTLPAAQVAELLSQAASDLWNIGDYSFSLTLKGSVNDYEEYIDAKPRTVKVEMESKVECSGRWLREHISAITSILPKLDATLDYSFEIILHPEDPLI